MKSLNLGKKRIMSVLMALVLLAGLTPGIVCAEAFAAAQEAGISSATNDETAEPTAVSLTAAPTQKEQVISIAATPEPTAEPTATPEPTAEPTATPEPTAEPTATPEPTVEPTATPELTAEPTATPEPTAEPTATPEPTVTPEPSATPETIAPPTLEGFDIAFDGTTVTLVRYTGNGKNAVVPAVVGAWPVLKVASGAFANNDILETVTIAEGVTTLESGAFNSCKKLTSLTLPSSLTTIAEDAVQACPLLTVEAPEGTVAGDFADKFNKANHTVASPVLSQLPTERALDASKLFTIYTPTATLYYCDNMNLEAEIGALVSSNHYIVEDYGADFVSGADPDMSFVANQYYESDASTIVYADFIPTRTGTSIVSLWCEIGGKIYEHKFTLIVRSASGLPTKIVLDGNMPTTVIAGVHFTVPGVNGMNLGNYDGTWQTILNSSSGALNCNEVFGTHGIDAGTEFWFNKPGHYALTYYVCLGSNYEIKTSFALTVTNSAGNVGSTEEASHLFNVDEEDNKFYYSNQGSYVTYGFLGEFNCDYLCSVESHGAVYTAGDDPNVKLSTVSDHYEEDGQEHTYVELDIKPTRTGKTTVKLWAVVNGITYYHFFTFRVLSAAGLPTKITLDGSMPTTVYAGDHFNVPGVSKMNLSAYKYAWADLYLKYGNAELYCNEQYGNNGIDDETEYWINVPGKYTLVYIVQIGANYQVTANYPLTVTKPLTISSVTPSKTSAPLGTSITWTVVTAGGSGAKQYYYTLYNGSTVVNKLAWGSSATFTFKPTAEGTYKLVVRVKDSITNVSRNSAVTTIYRPVTSIALDKTKVKMTVGQTLKLIPTIGPSNATNKTIVWTSSNTGVATVSAYGTVKAISAGTAVITAKPSFGSPTTLSVKCTVNVI